MIRFATSLVLYFSLLVNLTFADIDPLPSWNDGNAKNTIIQFIKETTEPGSPNFIKPSDRIATFDQDGTLWLEQPFYTEAIFGLDTIKALAPEHPEWKNQEPYKSILDNNMEAIKNFTLLDIEKMIAASHAGITTEAFQQRVHNWFSKAINPRFKRPYTQLIYQPMLEVINLFKAKGFKTYIVSGGGQEFIRDISEKVYGIPVEQVIGSASKLKYEYQNNQPVLMKLPEVLFIDDKTGKPSAIQLIIGKRPVAAFGNSDGDQQMLEWSQTGNGKRLQLLVHHDDAEREYAYDTDSKIGTFSKALMDEAKAKGWIVVSMKNDWKVIFPWEAEEVQKPD